jgi:hypothetical protein
MDLCRLAHRVDGLDTSGRRSARPFIIMIITYVVSIGGFSHLIAGSVEAAYAVETGGAPWSAYSLEFFLPTLIGNKIVEVALVAGLKRLALPGSVPAAPVAGGSDSLPAAFPFLRTSHSRTDRILETAAYLMAPFSLLGMKPKLAVAPSSRRFSTSAPSCG